MLSRKNFLKSAGAVLALNALSLEIIRGNSGTNKKLTSPKIIPKALKKGDTIGLVTPSGLIKEEQLLRTVEKIEGFGFKTYYLPSVMNSHGYFAGTDQERADELMHMFSNPEIDGIWCVRGGYGGIRVLELLDYNVIRNNPKVFVGYSDITAYLNAIYQQTGLVTYHGPLGISSFNNFALESVNKVILTPEDNYKYPYEREPDTEDNPEFDLYTITRGKAEGELIGGNLSVMASMAGSKHEIDFKDKIVFLEDVDEKTYRVDRMLTQLIQATNLSKAAGIVLGTFSNCSEYEEPSLTLKEMFLEYLKPLDIPCCYGLSLGHIANQNTFPIGIKAKFNAGRKQIKLLERPAF